MLKCRTYQKEHPNLKLQESINFNTNKDKVRNVFKTLINFIRYLKKIVPIFVNTPRGMRKLEAISVADVLSTLSLKNLLFGVFYLKNMSFNIFSGPLRCQTIFPAISRNRRVQTMVNVGVISPRHTAALSQPIKCPRIK